MTKLPLTIVTAVLNEEHILGDFLKHVCSIAQEVIVVIDHRTNDKSEQIARRYGCKVLLDKGSSRNIVFNNKNWGISKAKHDWVMIVDADERLDKVLQEEVSQIVLGKSQSTANIFQTSFINFEFGKTFEKSDQKLKPFIRLFKKGYFTYSTQKTAEGFGIHTESLAKTSSLGKLLLKIPKVRSWYLQKQSNIVTLRGHLIHFSHPNISEFLRKIDLYSTREANILFKSIPNQKEPVIVLKMFTAPIKEFIYKYFIWKFYREGVHGFIASVIYAFYHFLIYAKYYYLYYKNKHKNSIEKFLNRYNWKNE